jgi:hypothetical protein
VRLELRPWPRRKPLTRPQTRPGSGNPTSCEGSGIPDSLKDLYRQELIAEPPVEALSVAVLPRVARFDAQRAIAYLLLPATKGLSNKLGPVVAADGPRHTTRTVPQLSHERWYRNWGGVTAVDLQGQALACVLTHDRKPLQLITARRSVEHEVPATASSLVSSPSKVSLPVLQ